MKGAIFFINHIHDAIKDIEEFSRDITKENFLEDKKTQYAIIRSLEIIGEAVKNLPKDFTEKYSDIEWAGIAKNRDILIHKYFGVDLELVWKVIKNDAPILKQQINKILEELENNQKEVNN